ncbi:MAG: STAS/SEC14 domain-containing protein [Algoriphagus sp.]|uniref:STAS/SEC14 domain-containing protein n=1 Tax=Algoriphagus sp. TaxID=1872435 RepID=UPI00262604CC|nr:STAS/SEC14 domain-containing protein [Algoriphagus sp.]MDG1278531.1 STAS/SEC14 domain-containing protein [Algoriphagus sp.]
MEPYAIIDESSFPIIKIGFTGNKSTDQNFQSYLDQTKACYRNGGPLVLIFDASKASIPSLTHQKMQANWLKENEDLMKTHCMGTAYIIPNAAIRGILKMIFSFQKQPVPYRVVKTETEALDWVNAML